MAVDAGKARQLARIRDLRAAREKAWTAWVSHCKACQHCGSVPHVYATGCLEGHQLVAELHEAQRAWLHRDDPAVRVPVVGGLW